MSLLPFVSAADPFPVEVAAAPSIIGAVMAPFLFMFNLPAQVILSVGSIGAATLIVAPSIGHFRLAECGAGMGYMGLRMLSVGLSVMASRWSVFDFASPSMAALMSMSVFSLFALALTEIAVSDAKARKRAASTIGEPFPRDPPVWFSIAAFTGMGMFFDQREEVPEDTVRFLDWGLSIGAMAYPKRRVHGGVRLDMIWGVADGHRSCNDDCLSDIGHPVNDDDYWDDWDDEDPTQVTVYHGILTADLRWRIGEIVGVSARLGGDFRIAYASLLPSGLAFGLG